MSGRAVITVTGPVPEEELGFCQSHEHLFIAKGRSFEENPALWMDDVSKIRQETARYRRAGGGTLVDAQPVGCGRMCQNLRGISLRSGVHILAATGFHKLRFYPPDHWLFSLSEDALTSLFLHELTHGMYDGCDGAPPGAEDTGIRASLIKTALDACGLTAEYARLFAAAAAAAVEAGRALMVHIEVGSRPMALLRFLLDRGVPPERIIFCHTDRACADPGIRRDLAAAGVFLELDTIGRFHYHSDQEEADIFLDLLDAGFQRQLLFSLDATRTRLKCFHPQAVGLDYLLNVFLPLLRSRGVSQEQLALISHHNFVSAFHA